MSVGSTALAQNPPLTGTTLTKSVYQGRSLRATQSIELQPGFSVSTGGFEARVVPESSTHGSWSDPLPWILPNTNEPFVGIHTHLLPNGKILSWEGHNDNDIGHLGAHVAEWNPADGAFRQCDNTSSNIFCSGHAFLPDGKLFVAGGHYSDGSVWPTPQEDPLMPTTPVLGYIGIRDVNTFNWFATSQPSALPWAGVSSTMPAMTDRRWYPTVTALTNGKMLVISGQQWFGEQSDVPELWNNGTWTRLTGADTFTLLSYPWMFAAPGGKVFWAGPEAAGRYLTTTGVGSWGQ